MTVPTTAGAPGDGGNLLGPEVGAGPDGDTGFGVAATIGSADPSDSASMAPTDA